MSGSPSACRASGTLKALVFGVVDSGRGGDNPAPHPSRWGQGRTASHAVGAKATSAIVVALVSTVIVLV